MGLICHLIKFGAKSRNPPECKAGSGTWHSVSKMIKDRLKELRSVSHAYNFQDSVIVFRDDTAQDIELFLKEVEAVHDLLTNIRVNTAEIKRLYSIILSTPGTLESSNSEVAERQSIVNNTVRNVVSKINSLEVSAQNTPNQAFLLRRIQAIHTHALSQILIRLIEDYNITLLNHREKCEAIRKRQVEISNRESEMHLLLESNSAVFVDNIMSETLEAQLALNSIQSRHRELTKIESSLQELRDMFIQLSIHVEMQGEKMNCIRYLVEKSEVFAEHTIRKLDKAKKRAKRKRKICRRIKIILALLGIFFGLVLLIYLF